MFLLPLLALAGLCNQPAHADPKYTSTASGITPQSGSYPINHGYYGSSTTPASVPIAVAKQSVQVNGATPSRTIIVGWSMYVQLIVHTPSGSSAGTYRIQDYSTGPFPQGQIQVQTQPDGSWQHLLNNSGSFSETYVTNQAGNWTIYASSSCIDPAGNPAVLVLGGNFTTYDVYSI